jgi:hypothetical protein
MRARWLFKLYEIFFHFTLQVKILLKNKTSESNQKIHIILTFLLIQKWLTKSHIIL